MRYYRILILNIGKGNVPHSPNVRKRAISIKWKKMQLTKKKKARINYSTFEESELCSFVFWEKKTTVESFTLDLIDWSWFHFPLSCFSLSIVSCALENFESFWSIDFNLFYLGEWILVIKMREVKRKRQERGLWCRGRMMESVIQFLSVIWVTKFPVTGGAVECALFLFHVSKSILKASHPPIGQGLPLPLCFPFPLLPLVSLPIFILIIILGTVILSFSSCLLLLRHMTENCQFHHSHFLSPFYLWLFPRFHQILLMYFKTSLSPSNFFAIFSISLICVWDLKICLRIGLIPSRVAIEIFLGGYCVSVVVRVKVSRLELLDW